MKAARGQLLTALLLYAVQSGWAYPSGPPGSTCVSQYPKHRNTEKQTGVAPFGLVLSSSTYTPGQNITVRVENTDDSNRTFVGFQVAVHRVVSSGNAEEFIGTFSTSDNYSQVIDCLGQPQTMLGHNARHRRSSVSGIWTAPANNVGNLTFFLTVVENFTTIWHKITAPLQAASAQGVVPPQTVIPSVTVAGTSGAPNWTQCGETKGCWLVPVSGQDSCTGLDCQAALSYRKYGDRYFMEMTVKGTDRYIAVGFSEDKQMGDDQTVLCTASADHESVQFGYNPGRYYDRQFTFGYNPGKFYDRQFTEGADNLTAGQIEGSSYCTFSRQAVQDSLMSNASSRSFDLNNQYYIFLAWGHIFMDTDIVTKHAQAPAISMQKVNLTEMTILAPADPITTPGPTGDPSSAAVETHAFGYSLLVVFFVAASLVL